MTNKIPKPAYKILLGFLMLAFTVIACNSKKDGDKKDSVPDTTVIKMMDLPDTSTKMDAPKDTAKKKPVKDPS